MINENQSPPADEVKKLREIIIYDFAGIQVGQTFLYNSNDDMIKAMYDYGILDPDQSHDHSLVSGDMTARHAAMFVFVIEDLTVVDDLKAKMGNTEIDMDTSLDLLVKEGEGPIKLTIFKEGATGKESTIAFLDFNSGKGAVSCDSFATASEAESAIDAAGTTFQGKPINFEAFFRGYPRPTKMVVAHAEILAGHADRAWTALQGEIVHDHGKPVMDPATNNKLPFRGVPISDGGYNVYVKMKGGQKQNVHVHSLDVIDYSAIEQEGIINYIYTIEVKGN